MWDEIIYPFPNLNGCTIKVCEWCNYFSWSRLKLIQVNKRCHCSYVVDHVCVMPVYVTGLAMKSINVTKIYRMENNAMYDVVYSWCQTLFGRLDPDEILEMHYINSLWYGVKELVRYWVRQWLGAVMQANIPGYMLTYILYTYIYINGSKRHLFSALSQELPKLSTITICC